MQFDLSGARVIALLSRSRRTEADLSRLGRFGKNRGFNQLWKRRLIKMLVTIIILFALCWLPMHVRSFLYFFRKENYPCGLPPYLDFIGYFMAHANAALNPCVYFSFNRKYWKKLLDGVSCTCCSFSPVFTSRSATRRNPQRLTEKSNAEQ